MYLEAARHPISQTIGRWESYAMQLGSEESMDAIEERLEELIEEVKKLIDANK